MVEKLKKKFRKKISTIFFRPSKISPKVTLLVKFLKSAVKIDIFSGQKRLKIRKFKKTLILERKLSSPSSSSRKIDMIS